MEKLKKQKYKFEKRGGITLIALVITIIVMLILAAISITMLTGDNSILKRAAEAKEKTEYGEIKDIFAMSYADAVADKYAAGNNEVLAKLISNLRANGCTVIEGNTGAGETDKVKAITLKGITGNTTKIGTSKTKDIEVELTENTEQAIGDKPYYIKSNGKYYEIVKTASGDYELATTETDESQVTGGNAKTYSVKVSGGVEGTLTANYSNNKITLTSGSTETQSPVQITIGYVDEAGNQKTGVDVVTLSVSVTNAETAEDIASKTFANDTEKKNFYESFYGSVVTNYGKTIDTSLNDQWKIFYADGEHIYLIADSYVNYTSLPTTRVNGTEYKFVKGNTDWKANFGNDVTSNMMKVYQNGASDISDKIIGSKTITAERIKGLNNSFFYTKTLTGSGQPNMQAVASMLDVDLWKAFMDASNGTGKAEYAIGGPTVEMFMVAYNQSHGTTWTAEAKSKTEDNTSADGYYVGTSSSSLSSTMSGVDQSANKVYRPETNPDNTYGFWLASPMANYNCHLVSVLSNGNVGHSDCRLAGLGFRPLVCLKSNVQLVKTGERQYRISD